MPEPPHERRTLLLSLLAAVVAVLLLRAYMTRFKERETGGPPRSIVVLTEDLPAGATLRASTLATRSLPSSYVESRHVRGRELPDVVGARLAVPGRASEALLWSDLASMRRGRRRLANLIPEGLRAITLDLRKGSFNSLLNPGDRVDVVIETARADEVLGEVAQNLLVLSVGDDLGGAQRSGRGRRSNRVALAVTLAQARRIAQAEQRGGLRLLLRHPDDLALGGVRDE